MFKFLYKGWSLPFVIFKYLFYIILIIIFTKLEVDFGKFFLFFIFVTILNFYLFSFGDFLVNSHEEMKLFFKDETVIFIKNYFFKNFLIYIILNLLCFFNILSFFYKI